MSTRTKSSAALKRNTHLSRCYQQDKIIRMSTKTAIKRFGSNWIRSTARMPHSAAHKSSKFPLSEASGLARVLKTALMKTNLRPLLTEIKSNFDPRTIEKL